MTFIALQTSKQHLGKCCCLRFPVILAPSMQGNDSLFLVVGACLNARLALEHHGFCLALIFNYRHDAQLVDEAHHRWLVEEEGVVDDITAVVVHFTYLQS